MAQTSHVKAVLHDSSSGEAVGFATVSLTKEGAKKPEKYVLSESDGKVEFTGVHHGTYLLKAELLGYKTFEKTIKLPDDKDLGEIKMDPDREQLEAASVSAVGNPIIIKKDTIEYNASSFKTTDNDVLEDLLKKLPGFDVSDDGSITINGKTVNKITIDGKTFFLDDPQLASKNIPAKVINKLKVIDKKSDQAEFTGIDDGEEETVIDLTVKPGMMKGTFGNIMGGGGHDIKDAAQYAEGKDWKNDGWRYQGGAFIGKFTEKTQLSLIANANNTNNRGFNDLSGSMMGNMRGGGGGFGGGGMGGGGFGGFGGGNGITTSWMGGVNGAWTLFDNKMDLSGNYLYNNTQKLVEEQSSRTTYLPDYDQIYNSDGVNDTRSWGHRFGARLEHKFSENTSIIFQPQINFGGGNYTQTSEYNTDYDRNGSVEKINRGNSANTGDNRNFTASGFALLRQRLGKPGRTLTVMGRYNYSHNELNSINLSNVYSSYVAGDEWGDLQKTNQTIDQTSNSHTIFGRVTYTEPLGEGFFVEANYGYDWSRSSSEKNTYDNTNGGAFDPYYSNSVVNDSKRHDIGTNFLYQNEKFRAQIGFSAQPTTTHNETYRAGQQLDPYDDTRWRFAPSGMLWWEMGENANMRVFYRGSSNQPSVSQLIPVPDNTNPLRISFGNPYLAPYFNHSVNGDYRFNNKKSFASVNVRFNGSYVQDPITTATWYGTNGAAYSMPFNGPDSFNFGGNIFANMPLGQSNFTLSNMARVNYSTSASYVGGDDVTGQIGNYYDATTGDMDYTGFMKAYNDGAFKFDENIIRTVSAVERLRVTYRNDALEVTVSGRTRMNKSWYTINENADNTMTFNNQATASVNWTWDLAGLTFKSDYNFNWYNGYSSELNYTPEHILNAEIQKLLLNNTMTIALKGYDILGQAKNLSVTDNDNYHSEVINNTLGRYIILSLTWRFGNFDRSKMRGPGGMRGGPGGGPGGPPPLR
ncbi:MAG: outer membrane beta-barrel protein [Bacteroidales bacterium]|nr:outer membrane beta-barrel protein [Bacteroidales bacterium]